ncbi:MAG: hypothetical protein HUK24_03785 [Sphaerochaetaceae bacterium]|nr:hypothetical protein [Sphaerochaetaceae bacterium]
MEQVLNYIESINETKVTINGAKRDTISLFDFSCFREGWANACIHNNWSSMLAPSVYIFSDRIEILSYGGLRRDLTPQEFFQGISKPVNRRLQSIMEQLGYGEQTGHGVPKIVSVYGMMAFEIMDNSLRVTIPFNKKVRNISYDYGSVRINGSQQKILNYLKENPFANIVEIEENLSMSDGNTRKVLQILKDKGLLVREGAKKNGYWKVIDNR